MRRRLLLAFALAVVAAGIAIGTSTAAHPAGPLPEAQVTIRRLTADAARGTYCIDDASHGGGQTVACGEGAYPLRPRGRLPAPPEARVRVKLNHSAEVASARLVRVDGDGFEFVGPRMDGRPGGKHRRRWQFRLPADLEGADALSISTAGYRGEDANLWAGIRPVARWPRGGDGGDRRRPAFVTTHALMARAALGSHCLPQGDMVTGCGDYAYPPDPHGRLPATPGARVRIDLPEKATGLSVSLARQQGEEYDYIGPTLSATPANGRRRWRLRLPEDLGGANRLSIDVDYADGDAHYSAGLRRVPSWP